MFLMWLGEQITERGIGNGISMIIFSGIVAGLPAAVGGTLELVRTGEMNALAVLAVFALVIAVTAFVVFVERGQRRITVNYARRQQGRKLVQAQSTHLPLKINMAGVIPPIFASSIILFPGTLGQWFGQDENLRWLADIASKLSPGEPIYVILYASAIVFFCFFYTALVFQRPRNGGQPEAVRGLYPRHPPRRADRPLHRWCDDPTHGSGCYLHHCGLPAAGVFDCRI